VPSASCLGRQHGEGVALVAMRRRKAAAAQRDAGRRSRPLPFSCGATSHPPSAHLQQSPADPILSNTHAGHRAVRSGPPATSRVLIRLALSDNRRQIDCRDDCPSVISASASSPPRIRTSLPNPSRHPQQGPAQSYTEPSRRRALTLKTQLLPR